MYNCRDPMDKKDLFVHKEEDDDETPKQRPNAKSLLLQCLRDSKSDPISPRRRFRASYSDDEILMDGVLVTSATSLGHKYTEFSRSTSESGRNQTANPSKLEASAEPNTLTLRSLPKQLPYDHYNPLFPWTHPLHLQPYPYLNRARPPFCLYQRPLPLPVLPHGVDKTPIENDPCDLNSESSFPSLSGYKKPTKRELKNSHLTKPSYSLPNTNTGEPAVHTPTDNISTSATTTTDDPSGSSQPNTNTAEPTVHTPTDNISTSTTTTTNGPSGSSQPNTNTGEPAVHTPTDNISTSTTTTTDGPSGSANGLDTMTQNPELSSLSDERQTITEETDLRNKKYWHEADCYAVKDENGVAELLDHYRFSGRKFSKFSDTCSDSGEQNTPPGNIP